MKKILGKFFKYLILAVVLIISIYPILWVFINSFKETPGGLALPEHWVLDGYISIFTKLKVHVYFANSLIITLASTFISVLIVSLSAYVSARMQFKFRSLITMMFTTTLFIPSISISFPIYRLLGELGLRDTRVGVILVYSGLGIAVTYFILRSYFLSIPKEIEEAARIDGANQFQIYWKIFMPIMKPSLILVGVLNMLTVWNDYLGPLIFLQDRSKYTLALGLASFKGVHSTQIIPMLCITIIMIIPPIIIFIIAQKYIVEGTSGSIK